MNSLTQKLTKFFLPLAACFRVFHLLHVYEKGKNLLLQKKDLREKKMGLSVSDGQRQYGHTRRSLLPSPPLGSSPSWWAVLLLGPFSSQISQTFEMLGTGHSPAIMPLHCKSNEG